MLVERVGGEDGHRILSLACPGTRLPYRADSVRLVGQARDRRSHASAFGGSPKRNRPGRSGNSLTPQPLSGEACRAAIPAGEPEQGRSAQRLEADPRKGPVQPLRSRAQPSAGCADPSGVAVGGGPDLQCGTAHRPRAEPRPQPVEQPVRTQRKSKAQSGQSEELAERTQHDRVRVGDEGQARFGIGEALVDDQQSAVEAAQVCGCPPPAVGIVGVDDDQHRGAHGLGHVADPMAGRRPTAPVLGVGRADHGDVARREAVGQMLDGGLRTGYGQDARRPAILRRRPDQPIRCGGRGQARHRLRGRGAVGIRPRIDAGREVDPTVRPNPEPALGLGQVAAVRHPPASARSTKSRRSCPQ